ncbi:hypothetical protein [Tenacibaculum sp. M341]|uniref:hypothetical protein n=1 Tax=Tenacibaculum sp. M341 TaxID=2530339 RepID=UPI001404E80E|nr:hypothetical protein [Tenacibaculum sp. M341]
MLKNISNLGTILNKEDQKSINGGRWTQCGSRWCCITLPNGYELREPCYCNAWGSCILL